MQIRRRRIPKARELSRFGCELSRNDQLRLHWTLLLESPSPVRIRRRKMRGRPWARRKPRFWPIRQPGDLVQLDTKEVRPARGIVPEHFSARDMVTRWDVLEVHELVTSPVE
jgi:hypothetical protein